MITVRAVLLGTHHPPADNMTTPLISIFYGSVTLGEEDNYVHWQWINGDWHLARHPTSPVPRHPPARVRR